MQWQKKFFPKFFEYDRKANANVVNGVKFYQNVGQAYELSLKNSGMGLRKKGDSTMTDALNSSLSARFIDEKGLTAIQRFVRAIGHDDRGHYQPGCSAESGLFLIA